MVRSTRTHVHGAPRTGTVGCNMHVVAIAVLFVHVCSTYRIHTESRVFTRYKKPRQKTEAQPRFCRGFL